MWVVTLAVLFLLFINIPLAATVHAASGERNNPENEIKSEKHFVVTLRSSFTPIAAGQAKRDFPDKPVYLLESKAFGKTVHLLRVGFFSSYADALAFRQQTLSKYPAALVSEISSNEYAVISRTFPALKPAPAKPEVKTAAPKVVAPLPVPAPAPSPAAPAVAGEFSPKALFVVQLEESRQPIKAAGAPIPADLRKYRLYVTQARVKNKTSYQLKLGFFDKEQEVYAARKQLKAAFPDAKVARITPNERKDSVRTALSTSAILPLIAAPVPKASPGAVARTPVPVAPTPSAAIAPRPSATPMPATSYDRQALALSENGRAALARGDNRTAISAFDKLLRLPPNRYSQDAQELIGVARERAGESAAARKEYELYLSLYPTGEGSDRVRQRIAVLEARTATSPPPALKSVPPRVQAQSSIVGNFAQYYYHGASKVDTTTQSTATSPASQESLTQTDQSALLTNLNFTHRYRSEDYDNRFVVRDTYTRNFLQGQEDTNRPSAFYYELKDRKLDYSTRFGRQPGGTAGVLGRFDGLLAGYNFTPKWRLNAVGGVPVDITYDSRLRFYGASVDIGPYADHWGASLYTIQQKVDGVVDRNAVGSELRYFDPSFSVYGLFDYDTEFQTSNITLIQGNWTGRSGTTAHVLFDRRKTPALELVNALIGESDTSISSQLKTKSYDQLKQQALDLTATTDLHSVGMTQALSTRWQAGLDLQSAQTSGTVGSANLPAQPDTGTTYTYTGNLIGTGLFTQRDVTVVSLSQIDGKTVAGNLYSLTSRLLWGTSWGLDTTLVWYSQHDTSNDTDLKRFSPTLKPSYKWKQNITFEAEFGEEHTTTKGPITEDKTTRRYWSLGYRWDF
jgi:tetratricopeptide (TPR) repeat protein